MSNIAFIGLGTMGGPMAGHLAEQGHAVTVHNRTAAKANQWMERYSGRVAATPCEAAQGADFVITCVGNDEDLFSVVHGPDGALAGMSKGALLIDHTTASAIIARALDEEAAKRGLGFIDAPVSGGQSGAESGTLAIMVGGSPESFDAAQPILKTYAKVVKLMGGVGSGQLTKMVNQICIAGLVQGLAEGIAFGNSAGLDMQKVLSVISQGAAGSWQMENRAQTMLDGKFDFGFAVDWMRKDLSMSLDEARRINAKLPVTALIDQFYADVQASGGGRFDTSSLITRL